MLAVAHQIQPDLTGSGAGNRLWRWAWWRINRRGMRNLVQHQRAAQLETSKSFARSSGSGISTTAHYAVCTSEEELAKSLGLSSTPVVVKADGMDAAKGRRDRRHSKKRLPLPALNVTG